MIIWWILGGFVLLLLIVFGYYNKFVILSNRIDNSLSQIDVQFKRRADLIPNLIETVKGYAKHEKEAIKEVTEARKALLSAKHMPGKIEANNMLEHALKSIFAIAEGYPDLKANENFLELQRELTSTEDRVAYARQNYNDSILTYNNLVEKFPSMIFARMFSRKKKEYIEISEVDKKLVKVKFN